MQRYLKRDAAADYIGVPAKTLLDWRSRRQPSPRAIKVGKHLLYDVRDLDEFMEQHKEPAA